MLNVSVAVTKDIYCVMLMNDGNLIKRSVKHIKDINIKDNSFLKLLYALKASLRLVRDYIQNNDCEFVVFEMNNSTLIGWLENGFAKEQYQEEFIDVMRLVDEIPMRFTFSYNKKPVASLFCDECFEDSFKVSGLKLEPLKI